MFCTNCGKQLKDGAKFCPYCGQKQKKRTPLQETVEVAPRVITGVSQAAIEEEPTPKPELESVIEPILDAAKDRIESLPQAKESKPKPEIIETKASPFVSEETASQSEDTKEIRIDVVSAMPYTAETIPEENSPQTEPQETSYQPPLRWESATTPKEHPSTPVGDVPPKRPPWKLIGILAAVVLVVISAVSVFFSIYNAPIRKFERALNSADYSTAAIYYGNGDFSPEEQTQADALIDDLIADALEDYNNGLASYESVSEWLKQMSGSFGELKSVSAAQAALNELKASKDQFQQAASAETSGDIAAAIEHYSNVSEQDTQYTSAQEKASALKERYKTEIIDQANKLADSGDYAGAYAVLKECQSQLGDDVDIAQLIEEYTDGIRRNDIQASLSEAEEKAQSGDYLGAINLLKKTDEQYSSDSQVTAKLAEYKQRYKEQVVQEANGDAENGDWTKGYELLTNAKAIFDTDLDQAIADFEKLWEERALAYAESLAGQSKYEDAVDALNSVMAIIGETDAMREKVEAYKKKFPVSLLDMEPVSGGLDKLNRDDISDIYGNCPNANASFYDWGDKEVEYLADGNYSGLSGSIIVPSTSGQYGYLYIYADDKLIYTSPKFNKKTEPIRFDVNISGAKFVTLKLNTEWGGLSSACVVAISDPTFHN